MPKLANACNDVCRHVKEIGEMESTIIICSVDFLSTLLSCQFELWHMFYLGELWQSIY